MQGKPDNNTIIQSTKWSAVSTIMSKMISPITNIVLARLLAPEMFGLVASFSLVTSFAEVFTDAGFQKYIVQHEFDSEDECKQCTNVAFWTNFGFSCVVWMLICVFRDTVATLVGCSGYGTEIAVLGLQIPLYAFSSIQVSIYNRYFRFKQLTPIRFATSLCPLLVTVPLAIALRNYWAIIIGTLIRESVNIILLSIFSPWKPKFYYKIKQLKAMLSDCLWLMADSFITWCTSYMGVLIVSRRLGTYYTGIYRTGLSTIMPYLDIFFGIVVPVLFSALSRLQDNRKECDRVFINYQKYVAYIVIPLGMVIFIYRDAVTQILLGNSWGEAALLIGCVGLAHPLCILTGQLNSHYFRALGRPRVALTVQSHYAIIMSVALLWAVNLPFKLFSVVAGTVSVGYSIISTVALQTIFKFPMRDTIKNLVPILLATLVLAVVSLATRDLFESILWKVLSGFVAVLAYISVLLILPKTRMDLKKTVNSIAHKPNE